MESAHGFLTVYLMVAPPDPRGYFPEQLTPSQGNHTLYTQYIYTHYIYTHHIHHLPHLELIPATNPRVKPPFLSHFLSSTKPLEND